MTLCIAWKDNDTVHFASDSRLTLAPNSYADVGIKVLSLPYKILDPISAASGERRVAVSGELGMCFAGSAVSSLIIKESLVELLKSLQHAPGYTDTSMVSVAQFVFTAYKIISRKVCETAIGEKGRATILIGGLCSEKNVIRVFQLETDNQNQHSMKEVLLDCPYLLLGSGAISALADIPQSPNDLDYFNVLKSVIDNESVESVGGHIQYGSFRGDRFDVYGIIEFGAEPRYWRAALDLNSAEFLKDQKSFVPGFPHIDPFRVFGGI